MAYVESAVVAYLRFLYYPDGFLVEGVHAVSDISGAVLNIEIGREVATIAMLAAVSLLTARGGWWSRLAFFIWAFGVWDIFYYIWLYVFLGWPPDLLTLDVLFLVPRPWVAPVLLPVTVSGIMMACAAAILKRTG
ncbi:MAG: hypothetical protein GF400_01090 [Candidatus Eisenbacteria bacterium]|nr:hypothetical protein [Candidatus Eisenbacteria bacterium]